jgi:ribosomal subunit interface protein
LAQISLTVRHGAAPDGMQAFATEKCARLDKFLRGDPRIEIVIERDHEAWKGEAILHGSRHHERLVAHDAHADAHGCIEKLIDKIGRQLGKSKEKRKDHHVPPAKGGEAPGADRGTDEPSYEEIVRRELKGGDDKKKKP